MFVHLSGACKNNRLQLVDKKRIFYKYMANNGWYL
jgi:hypothetical protein